MKRDIESQHRKMVVYRRERERERAVVSAFENLKIKEKERARDRRLRRARRHTHTERETEVSFRLVSEREENIRRHNRMITWSNNSAPFVARQNASINLLASSHRRSDVTSYSTFGKYTCQSRGGRVLSRGVHRD